MTRILKFTSTTAIIFALAGGSTAMAQSPADAVYNPNGSVLDVVSSGTPTPAPAATTAPSSGTAPETAAATPAPKAAVAPVTTAAPSTRTEQASTGNLPFTGFEAGFVGLAGLMLLAGGIAVRRVSREQD